MGTSSSERSAEVIVVGAGPAGMAAAIELADRGRDVLAIDRAAFPRDKTCGDGLTTLALRSLRDLGLAPGRIPSWNPIAGAEVHSPSGRRVSLGLPEDGGLFAAIARRCELDDELRRLATARGATLVEKTKASRIRVGHDRVEVAAEDGVRYVAPYVVVATGASRRLLQGLDGHDSAEARRRSDLYATRVYCGKVDSDPTLVHIWFEPGILPGYAWLFPMPGRTANVGLALHRSSVSPRDAVRLTRDFIASERFARVAGGKATAAHRIRGWRIPSTLVASPSPERVLIVGDAAGTGDPMTGEGVGQALRGGMLAAEEIGLALEGRRKHPGRSFRRKLSRAFRADQLTSRVLIRALGHEKSTRAAVRFMGMRPSLAAYFARWTFEAFPRSSVLSPWRFFTSLRAPQGVAWDRRRSSESTHF